MSVLKPNTSITDLKDWKELTRNLDTFFLIIMGCIVYLMQCGFAFLECGAVRSNNTTNILIKNVLDAFVGGIAYWLFGFALAYGENGNKFLGYEFWALKDSSKQYASWFFQYVFAATASTIVSGALAERCDFIAYLIYSFIISGFIYPIGTHWAWSGDGWLAKGIEYDGVQIAYHDFAGSGIVHLVGGSLAFVAALIIGPRIGRFDAGGNPRPIRGHSVPLAALGGFILFFGFLAFNGGSQLTISNPGDGDVVALAIVNTIIGASSAALFTLVIKRIVHHFSKQKGKWSLLTTLNGALAGMVSMCAGCNVVRPWCAFLIGIGASCACYFCSYVVLKMKVDDPLDAVAVHAASGLWGILAVPIFETDIGFLYTGSRLSCMKFVWQLAGAASYIAWSAGLGAVLFGILRLTKLLRVTEDTERSGLDIIKHDEPAYPRGEVVYAVDLKEFIVKHNVDMETIEKEIIKRQSSVRAPTQDDIHNGEISSIQVGVDNCAMEMEEEKTNL